MNLSCRRSGHVILFDTIRTVSVGRPSRNHPMAGSNSPPPGATPWPAGGRSRSFKSKEFAKIRELRSRRAKAVRRVAAVAIADGHGAEQHLFRRHVDEFAD